MKTVEERQLQGAEDHEKMPEGKTAIWENLCKDRDRRQATPKPLQAVLNLLLRTALRRELLSPGRQSALSMAMDQKKSSFFSCLHMTEMIFLLYRLFKTPALGEG